MSMFLNQLWESRIAYFGESGLYFTDVTSLVYSYDFMKNIRQVDLIPLLIRCDYLIVYFKRVLKVIIIVVVQKTNPHNFIYFLMNFKQPLIIEIVLTCLYQPIADVLQNSLSFIDISQQLCFQVLDDLFKRFQWI